MGVTICVAPDEGKKGMTGHLVNESDVSPHVMLAPIEIYIPDC